MRLLTVGFSLLTASLVTLGCERPPTKEAGDVPSSAETVAATSPSPAAQPAASPAASPGPSPGASPGASPATSLAEGDDAVPPLTDADGKPLPQTDDKPSLRSTSWEKRVALLFRAIQTDDPKVALPAFFPLLAYEQVKALPKPAADYNARLIKAFERDIHAAHGKLGNGAMSPTLVGMEVPEDKAKWMKPGSEGNKLGYYRVLGSKLRYLDASGGARAIDVTSLISWRGEWYVVHLQGFK